MLSRPEIQSAVIPFIIGFAVAAGLRKITAGAWIWALLAAFAIAALLINGPTLTPLTGTRKIILLILGGGVLAAIAPALIRPVRSQQTALVATSVLSVLWVFGAVVARKDATGIAMFAAGVIALILWLAWTFERVRGSEARLHGAGLALLLGTGLCATAGSSALLGQLGLALAAASGGLFLVWVMLGGRAASAPLATLSYLLPALLIGLAASLFARLPWYALIPLAAIPLAASLVPFKSDSRFLSALVYTLPGMVIALGTAFWVWQAGSSGSSGY